MLGIFVFAKMQILHKKVEVLRTQTCLANNMCGLPNLVTIVSFFFSTDQPDHSYYPLTRMVSVH